MRYTGLSETEAVRRLLILRNPSKETGMALNIHCFRAKR